MLVLKIICARSGLFSQIWLHILMQTEIYINCSFTWEKVDSLTPWYPHPLIQNRIPSSMQRVSEFRARGLHGQVLDC